MTEHYADEDVKAAVKATRRVKGGTIVGLLVENEVRLALDAVAPAIAARALREAADEFWIVFMDAGPLREVSRAQDWLRARADEIERKR